MLTEWAMKPIELGGDNRFVPYVLELLAWRETVDLLAKGDPRLGRLSAVLNARTGSAMRDADTAASIVQQGI
jgi:hypothetical protein